MAKMKPAGKLIIILLFGGLIFGGLYMAKQNGLLGAIAPKGNPPGSGTVPKGMFGGLGGGKKSDISTFAVVTWGGYAAGEYYNGAFKHTSASRFLSEQGVNVEFKIMDQQIESRSAFKSDKAQFLWCTADALPTEMEGLAQYDPVVVFQADWSQGGDAIVVRSGINDANQLVAKRIAFAEATPSHTFLLCVLDAAGLSYTDIDPVVVSDAIEAAKYFREGQVDAAVVWAPDDQDCIQKVPSSKILMSTKDYPRIIADVFIAKRAWVNANRETVQKIVRGWMKGAAEINASDQNKRKAARILGEGFGADFDETFAYNAINNARICTYQDNKQFFGLDPTYTGVTGERLYTKMTKVYKMINYVRGNIPSWNQIAETSFIEALDGEFGGDARHSAQKAKTYSAPTRAMTKAKAISTKQVSIYFATGASALDENSKTIIDFKLADLIMMSANRIRVEGNTDNTGSRSTNVSLSRARAQSVANYFVSKYNMPKNRFVVVGNGPDNPVADNSTEGGRKKNRRTEIKILGE